MFGGGFVGMHDLGSSVVTDGRIPWLYSNLVFRRVPPLNTFIRKASSSVYYLCNIHIITTFEIIEKPTCSAIIEPTHWHLFLSNSVFTVVGAGYSCCHARQARLTNLDGIMV